MTSRLNLSSAGAFIINELWFIQLATCKALNETSKDTIFMSTVWWPSASWLDALRLALFCFLFSQALWSAQLTLRHFFSSSHFHLFGRDRKSKNQISRCSKKKKHFPAFMDEWWGTRGEGNNKNQSLRLKMIVSPSSTWEIALGRNKTNTRSTHVVVLINICCDLICWEAI